MAALTITHSLAIATALHRTLTQSAAGLQRWNSLCAVSGHRSTVIFASRTVTSASVADTPCLSAEGVKSACASDGSLRALALQKWSAQYASCGSRSAGRCVSILTRLSDESVNARVANLAEGLGARADEAAALVMCYPKVLCIRESKLSVMLALLRAHGVTAQDLCRGPAILGQNVKYVGQALTELRQLGYTQCPVALVACSPAMREQITAVLQEQREVAGASPDHEAVLAEVLRCSVSDVRKLYSDRPLMAAYRPAAIVMKAKLLIDQHGLEPEYVRTVLFPNVVPITLEQLKQRLVMMERIGMTRANFKYFAYAVYCSPCLFERHVEKWQAEKDALSEFACATREEYLCKRLQCDFGNLVQIHKAVLTKGRILLPSLHQSQVSGIPTEDNSYIGSPEPSRGDRRCSSLSSRDEAITTLTPAIGQAHTTAAPTANADPLASAKDETYVGDSCNKLLPFVSNKGDTEISFVRLKERLDTLLLDVGLPPREVVLNPLLLVRKSESLRERRNKLVERGMKPLPKYLIMTERSFAQLLRNEN